MICSSSDKSGMIPNAHLLHHKELSMLILASGKFFGGSVRGKAGDISEQTSSMSLGSGILGCLPF